MITQRYPNPLVKKQVYKYQHNQQPTVYYPPQQQQQHKSGVVPFHDNKELSKAAVRASKLGISTNEWLRRDRVVKYLAAEVNLNFGDPFYPSTKEQYELYGECFFIGACNGYEELENEEWPDNDAPLIFHARSVKGGIGSFFCNKEFICKEIPTK